MPSSTKSPKRSAARRRWVVAAVVLVAAMAAAGYLVSRGFQATSDSSTAAAGTPAAGGVPTAAASSSAGGPVPDPRGGVGTPVVTEPPDDVATDEPYEAPDGGAVVDVSYADWDAGSASVRVNAFVSSVVEDGGTCTLTLTRGGDTRSASGSAFADASTTICRLLRVPGDSLAPGTWAAVVSYAGSADGASAAVEVTVP